MTNLPLELTDITKRYGDLVANDHISLSLRSGEILALLGENGAGKTTLMNILFGHYVADEGTISVFGKELPPGSPHAALEHGIGMVHQHFTLADNMSVLDNITLGTESLYAFKRGRSAARKKIENLSARFGLEVDPLVKVKHLSVGERQRVEILKALYRDSRILILDEPTAVLTPQESETLFRTLRLMVCEGLSVIFISHKLKEVVKVSDRCCVLRHGKLVYRAHTRETDVNVLASAMVGGKLPTTEKTCVRAGKEVFSLKEVCTAKEDDDELALDQVSLSVKEGEILGIAGVSGNGQAQLADLISGLLQPKSGEICFSQQEVTRFSPSAMIKQGLGRIPEDRVAMGVVGDMEIQENMILETYKQKTFSSWGFLKFSRIKRYTENLIKRFDIRCSGPEAITRQLSGGNMQKLILARVLAEEPKIILASQPTWGLDVGAANFVHTQLLEARKRGAAVLLISEDLDELFAVADRVQVMFQGRLTSAVKPEDTNAVSLGLAMSGHTLSVETDAYVGGSV